MDESIGLIYGLELQARALATQLGEGNEVRFFIATNSLKPTNQVHLLEYNEENGVVNSKIFEHSLGEVWKINSSPHDARALATCFSAQNGAQVATQAALLTMPAVLDETSVKSEFLPWEQVEVLDTEKFGERLKTVEYHPSQADTLACVVDGKVVVYQRAEAQTRVCAEITGAGNKTSSAAFTTGKWSPHHQGNQFIALHDCSLRAYDVRDAQHCAWTIHDAHAQFARDLDCNPNKQCHIVTGGDDGCVKVWDSRMPREPVYTRHDHAHWVWAVRFNTFHDQLILSSSSDCKVMLTCAGSISSEAAPLEDTPNAPPPPQPQPQPSSSSSAPPSSAAVSAPTSVSVSVSVPPGERRAHRVLPDGLLQTFDQHEDSVYCVEWSNVDPWIFASLSYDGRLLLSKVPKQYKYQIIL